jgi:hypothetical protein
VLWLFWAGPRRPWAYYVTYAWLGQHTRYADLPSVLVAGAGAGAGAVGNKRTVKLPASISTLGAGASEVTGTGAGAVNAAVIRKLRWRLQVPFFDAAHAREQNGTGKPWRSRGTKRRQPSRVHFVPASGRRTVSASGREDTGSVASIRDCLSAGCSVREAVWSSVSLHG